jgi:hypothetical protein
MMALPRGYLLIGAALLTGAALWGTYRAGAQAGAARTDVIWRERMDAARATQLEAWTQLQATQQTLVATVHTLTQEQQHAMVRVADEYRGLVNWVQTRPSRRDPAAGPDSAGAAAGAPVSGATGAELSREDAEFLAGEAARADAIRGALTACYTQYDAVRAALQRHADGPSDTPHASALVRIVP